uniref:Uncharacterized protein n=1 Tax=Romanomermis culicivorax TaxID=13658 RepID=A0A915IQP6_ROMCU
HEFGVGGGRPPPPVSATACETFFSSSANSARRGRTKYPQEERRKVLTPTSMDIDSPQTSDGVDISEKRKNFRSKLLILSNSTDSLSSNQIDEYESMLADIESRQNQLRSKQSCTTARVIPNKSTRKTIRIMLISNNNREDE